MRVHVDRIVEGMIHKLRTYMPTEENIYEELEIDDVSCVKEL
jgi:hypothetical protein